MAGKSSLKKRSAALALLVFGVFLGAAWAQTETVLYSFCAQSDCTDGMLPETGVVFGPKGNLYGTTFGGGAEGMGVVFKLTPEGKETVLYSFCPQGDCPDGGAPNGGLVFDQKGNLYGTTLEGGNGQGVAFKLTPKGKETVVHTFCERYGICPDGAYPEAGVVFDQKGNLYGTTFGGGTEDWGVVYKLSPKGKETVLYSFCVQGYRECTDGANPEAGVVLDQKGNLYGTTLYGGANDTGCAGNGCGVVFKVTPKGKETVLYSFCVQSGCTDGAYPYARVVLDRKGNLYGTTAGGGAYGEGVVFKLTPKGKETVLYSFCAQTGCTDGGSPGGLVFDSKGNLYGTAAGGAYGDGVVFKLTPKGKETVLYSFCAQSNCADGSGPVGLVFDSKGNLYGTTVEGGVGKDCPSSGAGCGVVFKLTP